MSSVHITCILIIITVADFYILKLQKSAPLHCCCPVDAHFIHKFSSFSSTVTLHVYNNVLFKPLHVLQSSVSLAINGWPVCQTAVWRNVVLRTGTSVSLFGVNKRDFLPMRCSLMHSSSGCALAEMSGQCQRLLASHLASEIQQTPWHWQADSAGRAEIEFELNISTSLLTVPFANSSSPAFLQETIGGRKELLQWPQKVSPLSGAWLWNLTV